MAFELTPEQRDRFERDGCLVIEALLATADVSRLIDALDRFERGGDRGDPAVSWAQGRVNTIQNLPVQAASLAGVLRYRPVLELVEALVGGPARVTGALLFDKDPANNWAIGWHQDNGIYVDAIPPGEPQDVRGGLPVLTTRGMELAGNVSCRIALDPSSEENGGLLVMPGSHRRNLGAYDAERSRGERGVIVRQAPGTALFFRPLLLHRSDKSTSNARRRTLHLQYGPADLSLPGASCYPWPQPVPLTAVETLGAAS